MDLKKLQPLTPKQLCTLKIVKEYIGANGYSPTLKELADLLGADRNSSMALSTAQYYIDELIKKGYIKKNSNSSRGITIDLPVTQIPKLGIIAAGKPIEPIEQEEYIDVPNYIKLSPHNQYYALEVRGDSMMDMGIVDKDIIIIKHQLTAENGDVVVAITEEGATLKVFKKHNNKVFLEPRNTSYKTIIPVSLEIRGIFKGLIRY